MTPLPSTVAAQLPAHLDMRDFLREMARNPHVIAMQVCLRTSVSGWRISADALRADGVNPDDLYQQRNERKATALLTLRMRHRAVTHLILFHAENLPRYALPEIHELTNSVGATLVLVFGSGGSDTPVDFVNSVNGAVVKWKRVRADLPPTPPAPTPSTRPPFPEEVPWVNYPLFRWSARELLPSAEFHALDTTYQQAFRHIRGAAPANDDQVTAKLLTLFHDARNAAEVVTITRAAQAASLINGYHMRVDMNRILELGETGAYRRLNETELNSLWTLYEPWQPAAVILHDAGA